MLKSIKKVILSALSILGVSMLFWMVVLLNPSISYAHATKFDNVTVYHNGMLESNTERVIIDALNIIKESDLYNNDISIQLCLNDDWLYPDLQPWVGEPLAYAFLNKTVLKNGELRFNENVIEAEWEVNYFENRKFELTYLLAHEFMHNLQSDVNLSYYISSTMGNINWKLEGHAEYISRKFRDDGNLKRKIDVYFEEEAKEHIGIPVFELNDGTMQSMAYFKYAIVIQYLMEVHGMDFSQICELEDNLDHLISEMIVWRKS